MLLKVSGVLRLWAVVVMEAFRWRHLAGLKGLL